MRRILWLLVATAVGLVGWWAWRRLQDAPQPLTAVTPVPAAPDVSVGRAQAAVTVAESAPQQEAPKKAPKKSTGKTATQVPKKTPKKATTKDASAKPVSKKTARKKTARKKTAGDEKPKSP